MFFGEDYICQQVVFRQSVIVDNLVKHQGTTLDFEAGYSVVYKTSVFYLPSRSICSYSFFKCWLKQQRALKDDRFIFCCIDWL